MRAPTKVVIGSRESKLAVLQSIIVEDYLRENFPGTELSLLTMKTTGDEILDKPLSRIGGKGLFVKELDRALLEKKTDISVNSLKDMPMDEDPDLPIIAYSKREDPRDVLVLPRYDTEIDYRKPIGCGSLRRVLQLKEIYPQARFQSIRGNVLTRLNKLDEGKYSAVILASAGLKRMGLEDRISRYFEPEEVIPAAGQGILAVQGRAGEDYSYMEKFDSEESRAQAKAERSFVRFLNGGCTSPIAAYARVNGKDLTLSGLYYSEKKEKYITGEISGNASEAEDLGKELAEELRGRLES